MGPLCFQCKPIGYVRSPYKDTQAIAKGLGAKHEAQGVLEILAEFEAGLTDIEGFSHLIVIWAFDRAEGFSLAGTPPSDDQPHGVFRTRSPQRPNPIGLTIVELLGRAGAVLRVRGIDMLEGTPIVDIKPYLSHKRTAGKTTPRVARGSRSACRIETVARSCDLGTSGPGEIDSASRCRQPIVFWAAPLEAARHREVAPGAFPDPHGPPIWPGPECSGHSEAGWF